MSHFSAFDHACMAEALRLAELGLFSTTPNPRVGCVIAKDNKIIGQGWHQRAGGPHAEVIALQEAGEAAEGATAYVTLEPCSHYGRTPPCADALIKAKIARVVVAMLDPNPLVYGRGCQKLRDNGVDLGIGLLSAEAAELNIGFISRINRHRPWVRLKAAASLDGRTALQNGKSQWITSSAARHDGHRWRARACAILTGVGTVRADNPMLNVRDVETERQPWRIVLDSHLEIPLTSRLLLEPGSPVLIATISQDHDRILALRALGAEVVVFPEKAGKVDLEALMSELGQRGINELHIEAGAKLNGALLTAGLVDEIVLYLAPCLLGNTALGLFDLPLLSDLSEKYQLNIQDVQQIGQDTRFLLRPLPHAQSKPTGSCD